MTYAFTVPCANVAGVIDIWVNTGSSGAYEELGRSISGVNISDNPFFIPVHSDTNGGEQGPPVDYQYLGKQGFLSFEMAQYDDSVLSKVRDRIKPGVTFSTGMLIGCSSAMLSVILYSANLKRRYQGAIPIEPQQFNAGSVHSRASCSFICNAVGGVIWDTTVSAVE